MYQEKTTRGYLFSTDPKKLQADVIHHYLSVESYWAQRIPRDLVEQAMAGSLCFGVYKHDSQVGFARVITDKASFAYLADVFILTEHRSRGLSKELMKFIMSHEQLQNLRRFMLATKDAHGLYAQFGFTALTEPEQLMEIRSHIIYPLGT